MWKYIYVPTTERSIKLNEHYLLRYLRAKKFAVGKKVLDVGCGKGEGAVILGEVATSVVAVDRSKQAVDFANNNFGGHAVEFVWGDITKQVFDQTSFDLVTAFEVIEHLPVDNFELFVRKISSLLNKGGILLLSTPNNISRRKKPLNPYHTHEFTVPELRRLLSRYFKKVEIEGLNCINSEYIEKRRIIKKTVGFQIAEYLTRSKTVTYISALIPQIIKKRITSIDTLPQLSEDDYKFTRDSAGSESLFAICRFPITFSSFSPK